MCQMCRAVTSQKHLSEEHSCKHTTIGGVAITECVRETRRDQEGNERM